MNNTFVNHIVKLYISQLKNIDNGTTLRLSFPVKCRKGVDFNVLVVYQLESFTFLFFMFLSILHIILHILPDIYICNMGSK